MLVRATKPNCNLKVNQQQTIVGNRIILVKEAKNWNNLQHYGQPMAKADNQPPILENATMIGINLYHHGQHTTAEH